MANSADPDQTPRSVASDLGLYCSVPVLYAYCGKTFANLSKVAREIASVEEGKSLSPDPHPPNPAPPLPPLPPLTLLWMCLQ